MIQASCAVLQQLLLSLCLVRFAFEGHNLNFHIAYIKLILGVEGTLIEFFYFCVQIVDVFSPRCSCCLFPN